MAVELRSPKMNKASGNTSQSGFKNKEKPIEVRRSNIHAAKAVSDAIRTSLGPKGMDKMIKTSNGEVLITNDGATILKHISVLHPTARMLVDLSHAQDSECGDGTTSVVILAGSLLNMSEKLLDRGIHPTVISDSLGLAVEHGLKVLNEMADPILLSNRKVLLDSAITSLSSKVVSQYANLAPLAVDAVLRTLDPVKLKNNSELTLDLNDIKVIKKVGGTIEDTELVSGLALNQLIMKNAEGPTRMEKAKVAIIQFQLSAPKPDMDSQTIVNDYRMMDRILKEERQYLLNLCKIIKKSGCNVLLIQKSILRDAISELALHFLAKLKILVIKDIERSEIEFICKTMGCKPIADIDSFVEAKLGYCETVSEHTKFSGDRVTLFTGLSKAYSTVSIIVRGANGFIVDEAERSLHDALCVLRCLVRKKALIAGGGAPEMHVAQSIRAKANNLQGAAALVFEAFADALEVIPSTLAENAGLDSISIVTELRNAHASGMSTAGINVRKGVVSDIREESICQPLLVSTSILQLATETVRMILKIDDIVQTR